MAYGLLSYADDDQGPYGAYASDENKPRGILGYLPDDNAPLFLQSGMTAMPPAAAFPPPPSSLLPPPPASGGGAEIPYLYGMTGALMPAIGRTPSGDTYLNPDAWGQTPVQALDRLGMPTRNLRGAMYGEPAPPPPPLPDTPQKIPSRDPRADAAWAEALKIGANTAASFLPFGTAKVAMGARPIEQVVLPMDVASRWSRAVPDEIFASRSAGLHNPPTTKPVRPIEADYPRGAPVDETGRLLADIEGRPLIAKYIVGRNRVGEPERALSPADFANVAEGADGGTFAMVAARHSKLRGGEYSGRYDRANKVMYVNKELPPDQLPMVRAHELDHHLDTVAGYIPVTQKMRRELQGVYSTMATGQEKSSRSALTLPEHFGYSRPAADRELIVEGMRAYQADPNYFKTVAPAAAAAIREAVNSHPILSKVIQFNSVGGLGILGPYFAAGTGSVSKRSEPDL